MKEKNRRIMKVMMPNGGSGSVSPRLSLPIKWLREMGIDKEDRTVELVYSDGVITIKKLKENSEKLK